MLKKAILSLFHSPISLSWLAPLVSLSEKLDERKKNEKESSSLARVVTSKYSAPAHIHVYSHHVYPYVCIHTHTVYNISIESSQAMCNVIVLCDSHWLREEKQLSNWNAGGRDTQLLSSRTAYAQE